MSSIERYDRKNCPYSQKVRSKLDELGLDFEETLVPESHAEREEVQERTGQTGVPVLFDGGIDDGFLADSDEIIHYLEREYA